MRQPSQLSYLLPPIIFPTFFVLSLYFGNIGNLSVQNVIRSLVISVALAIAILILTSAVFRNLAKAATFTTICILTIFSYGHFRAVASLIPHIQKERIIDLVTTAITFAFLLFLVWIWRRSSPNYITLNKALNLVGISLLVGLLLLLFEPIFSRRNKEDLVSITHRLDDVSGPLGLGKGKNHPPDIYYIILDEFGSSSTLRNIYSYDDSYFKTQLQELGFVTPKGSWSNYSMTAPSIASSLNVSYLSERSVAARLICGGSTPC